MFLWRFSCQIRQSLCLVSWPAGVQTTLSVRKTQVGTLQQPSPLPWTATPPPAPPASVPFISLFLAPRVGDGQEGETVVIVTARAHTPSARGRSCESEPLWAGRGTQQRQCRGRQSHQGWAPSKLCHRAHRGHLSDRNCRLNCCYDSWVFFCLLFCLELPRNSSF